jgi:hypothetical protein
LPITYQLNIIHRQTLVKTGLKFGLYDCRHTVAARILDNGTDLLTLCFNAQAFQSKSSNVLCRKRKQLQSNPAELPLKVTLLNAVDVSGIFK